MFKRKRSKGQTMIYKILYRKVNLEQHIHINHCQIDYVRILWIEEDSITSRKKDKYTSKVPQNNTKENWRFSNANPTLIW